MMSNKFALLLGVGLCFSLVAANDCAHNKKLSTSKLICYYSNVEEINGCYCTHVILPANSDVKAIEKIKERVKGLKIYISVNEFNQGLIDLLKTTKIDGLELNFKKLDSKNDISDFISTIKSKIGTDLDLAISVPSKADLVAKYFDFKTLSKNTDLFILQTAFLGASTNVTFHPSRLSGMWDMQNTDSVVDLVSGLGAPLSKLVISAPVQAFQFTLQNEEYTAPGSPALEVQSITRNELCKLMRSNQNWTLERDEDQAGPYIFNKNDWIAFEDTKSMDIKVKYSRIRGLAGVALKDLTQDDALDCGSSILEAAYNGLSRQARAPRGAVLHSLEREIADGSTKPLDSIQLSPFKISRIIDTEGKIHIVRQDTRTEFQCSRQGYFVHPRSCNRFYRCVKFNQLSDDYNVFEFDCPAGLAFDERVEVCVWPGSLPHGTPCSGSSEIAPVPRSRFVCPSEPGYYADPENCRWFFACLDHGKSPLSAYEFRCPFGLVFDGERLVCEWPWLVPKCSSSGLDSSNYYYEESNNAGYNLKGPFSGVILENYNGIGQLGRVKLGGLSGKIEKPIATIYSNVDSGNLGLNYHNSLGYTEKGGLSYKASQALQNAGLLKVNNGVGFQVVGQNQGVFNGNLVQNGAAKIGYTSATSSQSFTKFNGGSVLDNSGKNDVSQGIYSGYQVESGQDDGSNTASNIYSGVNLVQNGVAEIGRTGATSTQSFTKYHGGSVINNSGKNDVSQGLHGTYQVESSQYDESNKASNIYKGVNLIQNGAAENGHTGAISTQSFTKYHGGSVLDNSGKNDISQGLPSGYQVESGQFDGSNKASDIYSRVNLVQNVATEVGNTGSQSFIQYHNAGQSANLQETNVHLDQKGVEEVAHQGEITRFTGAVGLQQQNNGFIGLNSPIYKQQNIQTGESIDAALADKLNIVGGGFSIVAISKESENAALLTSPSAIIATNPPTVSAPISIHSQTVPNIETINGGVIANTPDFQFKVKSPEEAAILFTNISSSFNNFVDKTRGFGLTNTAFTAKPLVAVTTEQPKLYVSSTIKPGYLEHKSAALSSVSFQKHDTDAFEGNNQHTVIIERQPQIVSSTPKTSVVVEHQPQIVVSSTPATHIYNQNSYTYDKASRVNNPAIISKFSIRKPTIVEDYTYQKPEVVSHHYQSQPVIPLYQQPQLLSTYTYQPPTQNQPATEYTYQNVALKSFRKPEVTPVHAYSYQPSGGSYQYVQKKQQDYSANGGYVYSKPSVRFEESSNAFQNPTVTTLKPLVTNYVNIAGGKESNQQQEYAGYIYTKPEVYVQSTPKSVFTYSNPKPLEVPQSALVSGHFNLANTNSENVEEHQGYTYSKPGVKFQEHPVIYSTSKPAEPAVINSYFNLGATKTDSQSLVKQDNIGNIYNKPEAKFEETPVVYSTPKPAVVTSYFTSGSTKAESGSVAEQQNTGYIYHKPEVKFEETPLVYSTPKPVQASKTYFNTGSTREHSRNVAVQQNIGYLYPKPEVNFEETPVVYSTSKPVVVTNYFTKGFSNSDSLTSGHLQNNGYHTSAVKNEKTPAVYSTPKPVQSAVVTSYFNIGATKSDSKTKVEQKNTGYNYYKPAVQFEETPVAHFAQTPFRTAVVSNYYNTGATKSNSETYEEHQQNSEYIYQKPETKFEQIPVQPALVTSYFNIGSKNSETTVGQKNTGYIYQKPAVKFEETPVFYSTPKSVQPAVVTTYFNTACTKSNSETSVEHQQNSGYIYQKPQDAPAVYSAHKPETKYYNIPTSTLQPIQPTVDTSYLNIDSTTPKPGIDYGYPQLEVKFHEIPVVHSTPKPTSNYNYISSTTSQPNVVVKQAAKPAIVTSYYNLQSSKGYNYPKSAVEFKEEPLPVQEVPFVKKTAYVTGQYQQNSQEKYQQDYQENYRENYEQNYQQNYQQQDKGIVENYEFPEYQKVKFGEKKIYIQSTPKPTFASTIRNVAKKPVTPALVTFYDSRLTSTPTPQINIVSTTSRPYYKSTTVEPVRSYLPITSTVKSTSALPKSKGKVVEDYVAPEYLPPSREYLPVEITTPSKNYLPIEVTTPSREYFPAKRVKVTSTTTQEPEITTLNREYLPVRTRLRITTTGSPVESYTIKPRKLVTVIKQNDAHPLLSAKLGAQCTCVSNTLKLRKKQKIIIVEDEDDNEDDGYIVDNNNNENYDAQKVVDITSSPLSSTTLGPVYVKKRVRPSVTQPVTEISEVFYKKSTSALEDESTPSDKEISKAVRTGLKLVKQAAKEGAKEGTQEVISKQFDRYGPGGLRGKSETLQGSIDCQRAGLFRHPSQCNKFYACRWDCTKNRFTLHVFNCPVHLTFDNSLGACNWPSQGPACVENTLIISD